VQGRTTFVIAHRLSTVRNCDLLLVLKQGRLQAVTSDFDQAVKIMADTPALASLAGAELGLHLVQ